MKLLPVAISALTVLALAGCASPSPGTCSFGWPVDQDNSPAPATRLELVDDMVNGYEEALASLPEDSRFHPEIPLEKDRHKLEALISVLGDARREVASLDSSGIAVNEVVGISGSDEEGRTGQFTIAYNEAASGYRVTDFLVTGIPDPDGYCDAD